MPEQPDPTPPKPAKKNLRETGIASVMTSTSIQKHPTAFANTRLPILRTALDMGQMGPALEPLLADIAAPGQTPSLAYARLLAYKQGNRGLIQYEVEGTQQGGRQIILGKLFPDASQAARVYVLMQTLWADAFANYPSIGVPQPLGCLADLAMLVYVPAGGQSLDEAVLGDDALHYMGLAGMWLGVLHQQRLPLPRTLNIANEVVNVRAWATLVGQKYPDLDESAGRIASFLEEQGDKLAFTADSPIHKDFHYAHVYVNEGGNRGLKVIDLDEMRLGDPNFDIAHFCANLHLLAYRRRNGPFQFSALQSAFLGAYARQTGWTANERCIFFYAYTCLKIAKQLCTVRGLRPRPEGDEQYRQTKLMVEQGLGALPQTPGKKFSGKFATQVIEAVSARARGQ